MIIILVSLLVLILSSYLFRLSSNGLSIERLNIISYIFYKDIVLMNFFGAVLIAISADISTHTYFWGISYAISENTRLLGWIVMMYTIITLPIGMILANIFFLKNVDVKTKLISFFNRPIVFSQSSTDQYIFLALLIMIGISAASIIYVFFCLGKIPLLYALKGGVSSFILKQMRADAKIHFSGIAAIKDLVAIDFTVLLSYILYAYSRFSKMFKYKVLFYLSLFLSIVILTYNLEKSPIFFYLVGLLVVHILVVGRVKLSRMLLYAIIVVALLIFVFSFFSDTNFVFEFVFRTLVGQVVALFQSLEYFPERHNFLGFSGVSSFLAKINGESLQNTGRLLFHLYDSSSIEDNTAGYIVGMFQYEAWALFGWIGLIFSPFYVGFYIQTIHSVILLSKKTPIIVGLYAFLFFRLNIDGFAQFIYPIMFFSILGLLFITIAISKLIKNLL